MSNTMLQVKRSATTAIPASLSNGELAYSGNATSNSLFIGHPDGSTGVIRIAGGKYPYLHQASVGTVTANAVVILDANGYTANVRSSGLFVSSSIASPVANATAALITSITPQANGTQLGAAAGGSNTELVTSYAVKTYIDGQITINGVNTATAYTFTNTISFSANVNIAGNTTSVLNIGGTVVSNLSANATTILFNANTTANGSINATAYSGTANNANNLGGTSLATLQGQITGNAATAYSNGTSYTDNKAANAYSNAITYSANASKLSTGTVPYSVLPANVVISSNNNTFTGTQSFASVATTGNLTVGGNLVVTGNLITQNVSSLIVSDPLIYLAGNNVTSDLADIGFAATYSNGTSNFYTGLIRKNSTDDYYLFVNSAQDLTANNLVNTSAIGFRNATLYSFLNSGALSSSNTALNITANATISVSLTANTLVLNTALAAISGGTGYKTYVAGDILYASNTTYLDKLARGGDGTVLQIQGTTVAWASLDGGTF